MCDRVHVPSQTDSASRRLMVLLCSWRMSPRYQCLLVEFPGSRHLESSISACPSNIVSTTEMGILELRGEKGSFVLRRFPASFVKLGLTLDFFLLPPSRWSWPAFRFLGSVAMVGEKGCERVEGGPWNVMQRENHLSRIARLTHYIIVHPLRATRWPFHWSLLGDRETSSSF